MVQVDPWIYPVLVLAEHWPSMSFVAQALGCLDITTWCSFLSTKSKVEFESTRLGSSLTTTRPLEEVGRRFCNQLGLTVLLQGGGPFVNHHRCWVESALKCPKTLEVMLDGDGNSWDSTFLWKMEFSHHSLGGITNGTWSARCSKPLDKPQDSLSAI